MPNEGERPTTADKGKGKVDDVRELNGKKPQKDEKTPAEGKKKDDEPQEGRSRHQSGGKHLASATHSFGSRTLRLTLFKRSSARRTKN
jgi:26S proteasome regulatory subunit N1